MLCVLFFAGSLQNIFGPASGERRDLILGQACRLWAVKCNKIGVLSLGWIEFACFHLLNEGDICVFEIINVEGRS
jgi:hypothetical protein